MRKDIKNIINTTPRQHSNDWYRARLGHFTGSQVGRLMKKGRAKDAEWSDDAITYIKEVVAERLLNPAVIAVPELFEQFLDYSVSGSKATAWGTDNEMNALGAYVTLTKNKVTNCGALPNELLDYLWDSPDGLLLDADGCVEVKCPATIKTHLEYVLNVHKAEDLLALKRSGAEYYWQTITHLANTGAGFCDWFSYCPFVKPSLHLIRIERDEAVIEQLLERVAKAEQLASKMVAEAQQDIIPRQVVRVA